MKIKKLNMTVDKFGHYSDRKYKSEERSKYLSKIFVFKLDGNNINIENRRVINVALPLEELDAVNKAYVNSEIQHMSYSLSEEINNLKQEINDLNARMKTTFTYLHH